MDSIRTSYQFLLEYMHLSKERTIFICYQFFKQIRAKYDGKKPIYTDGVLNGISMHVNG